MAVFIDVAVLNCQNAFGILVAIPKKAAIHIQKSAPGPPATKAVATPTIFPVPIVAERAVQSAPKLLTSPAPPSSLCTINLSARGRWRICRQRTRMVR